MNSPFDTITAATDGQVGYIRDLLERRDLSGLHVPERVNTAVRVNVIRDAITATPTPTVTGQWGQEVNRHLDNPLTKTGATKLIDLLKSFPEHTRPTTPRGNAHYAPVEDGFYVVDATDDAPELVLKVQTSPTSGRQYAKALDGTTWEYAPGAIRKVRNGDAVPLTLDKAKELGQLYGVCVRCGRTLTDEGSIAAGIGPICAGKF